MKGLQVDSQTDTKQIKVTNWVLKRYNEAALRLLKECLDLPLEVTSKLTAGIMTDLYIVAGSAEYLEEDRQIQEATDDN